MGFGWDGWELKVEGLFRKNGSVKKLRNCNDMSSWYLGLWLCVNLEGHHANFLIPIKLTNEQFLFVQPGESCFIHSEPGYLLSVTWLFANTLQRRFSSILLAFCGHAPWAHDTVHSAHKVKGIIIAYTFLLSFSCLRKREQKSEPHPMLRLFVHCPPLCGLNLRVCFSTNFSVTLQSFNASLKGSNGLSHYSWAASAAYLLHSEPKNCHELQFWESIPVDR